MKKKFIVILLTVSMMIMNTSCDNHNESGNFINDKVKIIDTGYGTGYLLIMKEDGTVYDVVGGDLSSARKVNGLSNIIYIEVGTTQAFAIDDNGLVWTWEFTQVEESEIRVKDNIIPYLMPNLNNVKMISAGSNHYAAIKQDGTVWLWGNNDNGQIGDGTYIFKEKPVQIQEIHNVVKIACGDRNTIALSVDGTVYEWGIRNFDVSDGQVGTNHPEVVTGIPKIKDIATGTWHSIALGEDGSVYTWGNNDFGQLGRDQDKANDKNPQKTEGVKDIIEVSAGSFYSIVLSRNGEVWRWGQDIEYVDNVIIPFPQKVQKLRNIKHISSACDFFVAEKNDNTLDIISGYKRDSLYYTRSVGVFVGLFIAFAFVIITVVLVIYASRKLKRKKNT